MDIKDIIASGIVHEIVAHIGSRNKAIEGLLADAAQDISLTLLEDGRHAERVEKMDIAEARYYIARIVANNLNSKTSRFYYKYRKNTNYLELNDKKVKDKY